VSEPKNIVDQGSKAGTADVGGVNDDTIGSGNRDRCWERDRLEDVADIVGDTKGIAGVDLPRAVGGVVRDWICSCGCSSQGM